MMRLVILTMFLTILSALAEAACPAPPVGDPLDRALQMVAGGDGMLGLSNTSVTDATEEGAVVYDDTNNTLAVCDGTNWIAFVSIPPTCIGAVARLQYDGSAWLCLGGDTTPDAFSFTDQTDVAHNTLITSNSVTISGIDAPTPVSINGDGSSEFRINGGSWVTSGDIEDGQSLELRLTSSASATTLHSATVNVGGVSEQWDVTTGNDPCSGSPSVGTTCADGSIYAGTTVGGVALYAAPADETGTKVWATVYQNNPGARSLSDGQANHEVIVTNRTLSQYPAIEACEDLNAANYLGYDDWYLPAKDELNVLYGNKQAIGGFGTGRYWSSSEGDNVKARSQRFDVGNRLNGNKSGTYAVRCVRR